MFHTMLWQVFFTDGHIVPVGGGGGANISLVRVQGSHIFRPMTNSRALSVFSRSVPWLG